MVLATLLLLASQGQTYDALGRTPAQIFAMGREKWLTVYAKEAGDGNQQMVHAYGSWAEAEQAVNDRVAKQQGAKQARLIGKLREDLFHFSSNVTDIAYALSLGGTMWAQISAAQFANQEDAIQAIVTRKPAPHRVSPNSVQGLLSKFGAHFQAKKSEIGPEFGTPSHFTGEMKLARKAFYAVKRDIRSLPPSASDWALGQCKRVLETAIEFGAE